MVLFGGQLKNLEDRKRSISESYECHPEFLKPLTLQDEIRELKLTIKTRDAEIENLRHEIHKLKVSNQDKNEKKKSSFFYCS